VIEEALRVDGEHPYHHRVRGDALLGLGRYQEALADYEVVAAQLGPDRPVAIFAKGLCKVALKQPDGPELIEAALQKDEALRDDFPGSDALLKKHGL